MKVLYTKLLGFLTMQTNIRNDFILVPLIAIHKKTGQFATKMGVARVHL